MDKLIEILKKKAGSGISVLDLQYDQTDIYVPNLTESNPELENLDLDNAEEFGQWLTGKINANHAKIAIGGYGEDRVVYKRSKHFGMGENARSIHLGVDLWAPVGTNVIAPFDSAIHSFKNNDNHGDYGGTIILTHNMEGQQFYTLYGHLSLKSLENKEDGAFIEPGKPFAQLGNPKENGGWPPHLHFQIIRDMLDKKGDFFGVTSPIEKDKMMHLCPNPNIILGSNIL